MSENNGSWEKRAVDEEIAQEAREKVDKFTAKIRRNKQTLANRGFQEGVYLCPDCGCILWGRYTEIRTGSDEWEVIEAEERECPCCSFSMVTYDS